MYTRSFIKFSFNHLFTWFYRHKNWLPEFPRHIVMVVLVVVVVVVVVLVLVTVMGKMVLVVFEIFPGIKNKYTYVAWVLICEILSINLQFFFSSLAME